MNHEDDVRKYNHNLDIACFALLAFSAAAGAAIIHEASNPPTGELVIISKTTGQRLGSGALADRPGKPPEPGQITLHDRCSNTDRTFRRDDVELKFSIGRGTLTCP
jgi:hypothetical protein